MVLCKTVLPLKIDFYFISACDTQMVLKLYNNTYEKLT